MQHFKSIDVYNKLIIPYLTHIEYLHYVLIIFCIISSPKFAKLVDIIYKRYVRRIKQIESDKTTECSICWEKIKDSNIAITRCNHKFHLDCLITWCLKNNTCPLCRKILCNNRPIAPEPSYTQHRLLQEYDNILFIRNTIHNRLNNIGGHITSGLVPSPAPAPAIAPDNDELPIQW